MGPKLLRHRHCLLVRDESVIHPQLLPLPPHLLVLPCLFANQVLVLVGEDEGESGRALRGITVRYFKLWHVEVPISCIDALVHIWPGKGSQVTNDLLIHALLLFLLAALARCCHHLEGRRLIGIPHHLP